MPLQVSAPLHNGVLYLSFNQDCTCLALGDFKGIKIYSMETRKICYTMDIGAVSLAEMLYCTSLMAFVGAGEQALLTPRKLTLLNTTTQKEIQHINYASTVLAVRLNRKRLVAVLERAVHVHALETMGLLRVIETSSNPKGLCALSATSEPSLLALPVSSSVGTIRVYDLLKEDGASALCEFHAHKSSLAEMTWNHDGTLLASASSKGTVIRIHRLPQATQIFTFRRGTYPAVIHSMAFSGPGIEPPLLCAASGHGTVHLFRLEKSDRHPAAVAASGLLAAVMPQSVGDMVDPPRCIATLRLPSHSVPSLCAVTSGTRPSDSTASSMDGQSSGSGQEFADTPVHIFAVTAEAKLYEYQVKGLQGPQGPTCSLVQESQLLGQAW